MVRVATGRMVEEAAEEVVEEEVGQRRWRWRGGGEWRRH